MSKCKITCFSDPQYSRSSISFWSLWAPQIIWFSTILRFCIMSPSVHSVYLISKKLGFTNFTLSSDFRGFIMYLKPLSTMSLSLWEAESFMWYNSKVSSKVICLKWFLFPPPSSFLTFSFPKLGLVPSWSLVTVCVLGCAWIILFAPFALLHENLRIVVSSFSSFAVNAIKALISNVFLLL